MEKLSPTLIECLIFTLKSLNGLVTRLENLEFRIEQHLLSLTNSHSSVSSDHFESSDCTVDGLNRKEIHLGSDMTADHINGVVSSKRCALKNEITGSLSDLTKIRELIVKTLDLRCDICSTSINPLKDICWQNRFYHRPCFKCHLCGELLVDKQYEEKNGQPCCAPNCLSATPVPTDGSKIGLEPMERKESRDQFRNNAKTIQVNTASNLRFPDSAVIVMTARNVSNGHNPVSPVLDDRELHQSEVQTVLRESNRILTVNTPDNTISEQLSDYDQSWDLEDSEVGKKLCSVCKLPLRPEDTVEICNSIFHRNCFRCRKCSRPLSVLQFKMVKGMPYCDSRCREMETASPLSSVEQSIPNIKIISCNICNGEVNFREKVEVGGRVFHRICFKCSNCKRILNIWKFKELEKGKFCCSPSCPAKCTEAESPKKAHVLCCVCNEKISTKHSLVISDKAYHLQCFTCAKCGRILNAWKYRTEDGKCCCKPNCQTTEISKDHKIVKGQNNSCFVCQLPVQAADQLHVLERVYHLQCFKCCRCGRRLNFWKFRTEENEPYCDPQCAGIPGDLPSTPVPMPRDPICFVCSNSVANGDRLDVMNGVCHHECFKCYKCGKTLNIWKFNLDNGKTSCHPQCPKVSQVGGSSTSKEVPDKCPLCKENVGSSNRIVAADQIYHERCFKCFKCARTLNIWKYKMENGQMCCDPRCFTTPPTSKQKSFSSVADELQRDHSLTRRAKTPVRQLTLQ